MVRSSRIRVVRPVYSAAVRTLAHSCGPGLKVNGWSRVSPTTILGENVNFNGMQISGVGQVSIGNNFHSGRECLMIAQIHNYEGESLPYDTTLLSRDISIGDNVWLGDRVIVLGGAVIGEGAIIQAGSVVVGEVPPLAIAGGHPATAFRYRDQDHYGRLKAAGRFL
ncbi:MAG: acyltransferase [Actinomycetia bacterium]|nr:acyltransferase [Actinomycetes bacterium]